MHSEVIGRPLPSSSDAPKSSVASESSVSQESEPRATVIPCARKDRFNAAILMIITLGLLQLLAVAVLPSLIAGIFVTFLAVYSYEFYCVHGPVMTRHRRAFFDVANVLETYQPRARTLGHLFQPEPPTPGVSFDPNADIHDAENANKEFTNARDSHYANMYEHALKMAKEMEAMEKAAALPALDAGQDVPLTAADPAADKKAHDDKKAKEQDEYKKQLEKPFSC